MKKATYLILIVLTFLVTAVYAQQEPRKWQTTGSVVLRSSPDANSEVVSYVKQGVVVEEISQTDKWVNVKTPSGKTGWIHKGFLTQVGTSTNTTTTTTTSGNSPCKNEQGTPNICSILQEQNEKAKRSQEFVPRQDSTKQGKSAPAAPAVPTTPPIQNTGTKVPPIEVTLNPTQGLGEQMSKKTQDIHIQGQNKPKGAEPVSPSKLLIDADLTQKVDNVESSIEPQLSYIVEPDKVTPLTLSADNVNRVVCPVDIKDVVYSEEKGVQVKIAGKNAFIKFLIKRIGNKEQYSNIPTDIYVVCGDRVYSMIAFPKKQPPVVVYLKDKGEKVKSAVDKYASLPVEKRIVNIVKAFSNNTPPEEAEFYPDKKVYKLYDGLRIVEKGRYVLVGEGMQVRVIDITAENVPTGANYVEIQEKDFLRVEITQTPLAMSLDKLRLYKGDTARLLVIEKSKEVE